MSLVDTFCPTGRLRASINLGNPILAGRDASGAPCGVSVDLARALAAQLGAELDLVVFDSAGKSVEAVANEQADAGFFAVDPKRGEAIAFTKPYVLIEGSYLVRDDSPLHDNAEVDAAGRDVVVGLGSAYDLFLTRELKQATIVRAPTSHRRWSTPSSPAATRWRPACASSWRPTRAACRGFGCCRGASW